MVIIKVDNPLYIGQCAPLIQQFYKRIVKNPSVQGISYETLYSYFANIVQFGKEVSEFNVALNEEEPIAFASWRVMGLPHYGTVFCEYIYNSSQSTEPMKLLADAFIQFGIKNKSPYYSFTAINSATARVFLKKAKQYNLILNDTGLINLIGRIENGR